jgi:hypothetical protein
MSKINDESQNGEPVNPQVSTVPGPFNTDCPNPITCTIPEAPLVSELDKSESPTPA